MPVEIFTKEQFDAALPCKSSGESLALPMLYVYDVRQYVWTLPVANGMAILVYSGIGPNGMSADCGEDSIRAVIIRMSDGKVYGSKLKRWVTRQPGWRVRLTDMLREMWKIALLTGPCDCGGTIGVYLVRKKTSKNKGRMFRRCDGCELLEWLMKDDKGALRREAA